MDRLTFKLGKSNPTYGLVNKASAKVGLFTDYDGFFAHLQATHKLGKYEDTDLTPEEIMALKAEKQKSDEGCEFCDFSSGTVGANFNSADDFFIMETESGYMLCSDGGATFRETLITFCPMCGKKLEVSDD